MKKIMAFCFTAALLVGCNSEKEGDSIIDESPKTQEEVNQEIKEQASEIDFYTALNGGYATGEYVFATGQIIALNLQDSLYTRLAVLVGFSEDDLIGYNVELVNTSDNKEFVENLTVGDGITVYGLITGIDEGTGLPIITAISAEENDYQFMSKEDLDKTLNSESNGIYGKTEEGTYLVSYFGNPSFEINILNVTYTDDRNRFYDGAPVESVVIIDIEGTNIGNDDYYLSDSYFNFYNKDGFKLSTYPVSGQYSSIEEVAPGRSAKISIAIGIDTGTSFEIDVLSDVKSKAQVIETISFE